MKNRFPQSIENRRKKKKRERKKKRKKKYFFCLVVSEHDVTYFRRIARVFVREPMRMTSLLYYHAYFRAAESKWNAWRAYDRLEYVLPFPSPHPTPPLLSLSFARLLARSVLSNNNVMALVYGGVSSEKGLHESTANIDAIFFLHFFLWKHDWERYVCDSWLASTRLTIWLVYLWIYLT